MAGGEEGAVSIWQAETGRLLAHCEPPSSLSPPTTALAYHPSAHLMVSGYFGSQATPVKIWIHGKKKMSVDMFLDTLFMNKFFKMNFQINYFK